MQHKSQAYFYPCYYQQIVSKISPLLCPISFPIRVATSGSKESSQDTAGIHVSMLMMRRGLLCSTYNEQISTIDDLITYINDVQPLGSDPNHVVPKEESMPNRKAS